MTENKVHVPVLIVGGGLVGLSAALFLSRYSVPYLLIERHKKTSIHPRARGFNFRTMELYRELSLDEEIRKAGAPLSKSFGRYTVHTLSELALDKRDAPKQKWTSDEVSPAQGNRCTQELAEPILLEAARKRGGDLRFHTELISLEQNDGHVIASVLDRSTGKEEMVMADYVIAADGSKSPVRHMLDIQTPNRKSHGHSINIYFECDLGEFVKGREFITCKITHPEAGGMLLAINNHNRWCFHVAYDPDKGETLNDFSEDRCRETIQKAIGLPDLEVKILSILPWEAVESVAECFQKDRIFLAGDSAHTVLPTGAYGANLGIQDAHNLAWKLAAVINKQAGPGLLETYNDERRSVAQLTAAQAGRMAEKRRAFSHTQGNKKGVEPINGMIVIVGYHYTSQAIIGDDTAHPSLDQFELKGRPGTRAPHMWGEYQGKDLSTLDLLNAGFVLFTGQEAKGWEEAVNQISRRFGVKISVYQIGSNGDFIDKKGQWQKRYQATKESAVLIRPDGFVCRRIDHNMAQPTNELEKVFERILDKEV